MTSRPYALRPLGALLGLLLWATAFAAALPAKAFGIANFTLDEVATDLQAHTNGSVHVVSHQVLTFSGENEGYTWYLHQPGEGESVKIDSIRAVPLQEDGSLAGEWTALQMVDVDANRQGPWPGDSAAASLRTRDTRPWYSYDISNGMVRSWFPAEGGTYMIEADYSIANYVRVYRDIADLSWRYVHGSLPVDSRNISLRIVLPVPYDTAAVVGDDVMAWGHGPIDGSFAINEDGTVVYRIDFLESGCYGEAHVIFPASWMAHMPPGAPHRYTEMHKQQVLLEEEQWVDTSTRGAAWDFQVRALCLGLAAAVLLGGLLYVMRFGFTTRSRRALGRIACILGIEALTVQLFLQESFTVILLLVLAVIIALTSLLLPQPQTTSCHLEEEPAEGEGCVEEHHGQARRGRPWLRFRRIYPDRRRR